MSWVDQSKSSSSESTLFCDVLWVKNIIYKGICNDKLSRCDLKMATQHCVVFKSPNVKFGVVGNGMDLEIEDLNLFSDFSNYQFDRK